MLNMQTLVAVFLIAGSASAAAEFPTWMQGSWHSIHKGVKMEEHWTSSDGDVMLGMHRDVNADGKTFFEFLRIQKKNGLIAYLAMPGGRPATQFPLKSLSASRVVFENAEHDFPQRVIYWRDGKGLCARVEGVVRGKRESEEWCWTRMAP